MDILAISGSLRAASLNTMLLRATARLAPSDIHIHFCPSLGGLPFFNPDIEASAPPSVATLKESIITSDALLIASPEYAHGVTGVIKNALDWMVGNESFINKSVAEILGSGLALCAQCKTPTGAVKKLDRSHASSRTETSMSTTMVENDGEIMVVAIIPVAARPASKPGRARCQ